MIFDSIIFDVNPAEFTTLHTDPMHYKMAKKNMIDLHLSTYYN